MGGGKGGPVDVDVLEKFYQVTKSALQEAKNEVSVLSIQPCRFSICSQRLSAKTNLKLAKLWLDRKEYGRLARVCSIHFPTFFHNC